MLIPITNKPQNYDWGPLTAISQILGKKPSGLPEAELWLGTHEGSPTRIADPSSANGCTFLTDWVARNDAGWSWQAAQSPLSLQVYPNREQAQHGFERENRDGIPLDSPNRNYKDSSAKPEIIVAVSDHFDALAGFRSVDQTIRN